MSWSELERLVEAAEMDPTIRHCLRQCSSKHDLVLVARHLGFRITRVDLQRAWTDHQRRRHEIPRPTDRAAQELP
jgi:predicted ribosomally synthesized peptide with nif11-like leader